MSINGINSTSFTYTDPSSLGDDAFLAYCENQLGSYGSDIKGYLDEQRLNLARKKGLADLENTVKQYVNHLDQSGVNDILTKFQSAIDALPPGDPTRGALQDKLQWFATHSGNGQDIYFTPEQVTAFAGDIHSMLDDVNGNAELNMMQLQMAMGQRQTAVQLTTGMIQKNDESIKSIVSNISR